MVHPSPEIIRQLARLHTQQMLREAEAERLAREARRGAHPSAKGPIAPVRAALVALTAIARIGQHHTPAPVEPVPSPEGDPALPAATPVTTATS